MTTVCAHDRQDPGDGANQADPTEIPERTYLLEGVQGAHVGTVVCLSSAVGKVLRMDLELNSQTVSLDAACRMCFCHRGEYHKSQEPLGEGDFPNAGLNSSCYRWWVCRNRLAGRGARSVNSSKLLSQNLDLLIRVI